MRKRIQGGSLIKKLFFFQSFEFTLNEENRLGLGQPEGGTTTVAITIGVGTFKCQQFSI